MCPLSLDLQQIKYDPELRSVITFALIPKHFQVYFPTRLLFKGLRWKNGRPFVKAILLTGNKAIKVMKLLTEVTDRSHATHV